MPSHIIGEIKLKNLTKFIKNFKILIFLYTNRRNNIWKYTKNHKNFLKIIILLYTQAKKSEKPDQNCKKN